MRTRQPAISPLDKRRSPAKPPVMVIFRSSKPLAWGGLDVPLVGLTHDWHGRPVSLPAAYSLAMDDRRLWFIAHHRRPADIHPLARPGQFHAELWKHDVAELFLSHPESGRYIEFNLAPNGAWWSCAFTAPRARSRPDDVAMPDVATFADLAPDGSWLAAMALPLDVLHAVIGFGDNTRANVTMILESPAQRFLTANRPGPGAPDFHQPELFSSITITPLDSVFQESPQI